MKGYSIFHNLDGDRTTILHTDLAFITFVRQIVIENEDYDYSILGVSDAVEYIEDYCPNLTLTILD